MKLLVCNDGSAYGEVCCQYAAWAAKRLNAQVSALYVSDLRQFEVPAIVDLSGSLGIQPYQGVVGQMQELEKTKAKLIEASTKRIFEEAGMGEKLKCYHRTGLLVDSIGDFEEKCDLILLGKRGENANFAKGHLGSMLERVVRSATRPCLITSRKFTDTKRVLLAYDGGKSAQRALEWISASPLFKGLELYVVSVAEVGDDDDKTLAGLKEVEASLKTKNIKARFEMLSGEAGTAITNYVEDMEIDLLVAGAYGHSRIRELLIGSTTTDLLRRCRIPFLCFR